MGITNSTGVRKSKQVDHEIVKSFQEEYQATTLLVSGHQGVQTLFVGYENNSMELQRFKNYN